MRAQSFCWPQAVDSSCRGGVVWTHRGAQWAPGLKGCAQGCRRHRGTVQEDLGLLAVSKAMPAFRGNGMGWASLS